jgi:UDP-N-acetylmuramyl pentapeptide synthase
MEQWSNIALENNLILLKGSRGIALEKLLPLL